MIATQEWMQTILEGKADPQQLEADLRAIEARGPLVEELVACATAMRNSMERIHVDGQVLDTCGTGGAKVKTFNISTPTAFLLAEAGLTIAKHGNRSVTRPSGSADILENAGANLNLPPAAVQQVLQEVGIAFCFAPIFHPSMRHAGPVRAKIGGRTIFNRLGPLANPASATHQLIGVGDASEMQLMGDALHALGGKGIIIHGEPGLDEASPAGPVRFLRAGSNEIETYQHSATCETDDLAVLEGTAAKERFMDIVEGRSTGPVRETIRLNAVFGLLAAEAVSSVEEGLERVPASGKRKWDAYVAATQRHT